MWQVGVTGRTGKSRSPLPGPPGETSWSHPRNHGRWQTRRIAANIVRCLSYSSSVKVDYLGVGWRWMPFSLRPAAIACETLAA